METRSRPLLDWLVNFITKWRERFGSKSSESTVPLASVSAGVRWTGYVQPKIAAFFEKIRAPALEVEARTGIPWRFAATQAAHESGWGLSKLTIEANNLFGITGDTWRLQGKPIYTIVTRESAKDGTPFVLNRPFRKYDSWQASLSDWADLITRRYPKAFEAAHAGDFAGFAKGLEEGGYATDRDKTGELVYAKKLIALHTSLGGIA